jgi:hypothetical protein
VVRDDEPEHGVTQELEPLVRVVTGILRTPRPVRERSGQGRLVGDRPAEPFVQRGEPGDRKRLDDQLLSRRYRLDRGSRGPSSLAGAMCSRIGQESPNRATT